MQRLWARNETEAIHLAAPFSVTLDTETPPTDGRLPFLVDTDRVVNCLHCGTRLVGTEAVLRSHPCFPELENGATPYAIRDGSRPLAPVCGTALGVLFGTLVWALLGVAIWVAFR